MQSYIAEVEQQRKKAQDELSSIELMIGGHESGITNIEQQLLTEANQDAKTELLSKLDHKRQELERAYRMKEMLKEKHVSFLYQLEALMARKQKMEQVLKTLQDRVSSLQLTAGSVIVEVEELEKKVSMETDTNLQKKYTQQLEDKKEQSDEYSYIIKQMQAKLAALEQEMQ